MRNYSRNATFPVMACSWARTTGLAPLPYLLFQVVILKENQYIPDHPETE
jgi:hypothetical protein